MTRRFGAWTVERSLPEGGQSWTYRVRGDGGSTAVLKLIKNPKREWRFDREIRALRLLKSPNIPAFIDSGEDDDGRPWIVTAECGSALTLSPEIGTTTSLQWFLDICRAIRDAHELGIVHRDIKPTNLVVSSTSGAAYLVDFGICTFIDSDPLTTVEAFGNAAFAAPECFLGYPTRPGPACDIYSAGKLLYWLVSRQKHIHRERTDDLEETICVRSRNIRARVVSLIRACVRDNPDDRMEGGDLLSRAQVLYDYAKLVEREEGAGIVRLVDNLGSADEFSVSSSRQIVSAVLDRSDVLPSVHIVGKSPPNIAQAEQFESRLDEPCRITGISVGMSSFTARSHVHIFVVRDRNRSPSGDLIGDVHIGVGEGPARTYSAACDLLLPPGLFWLVFTAFDNPATYANLHLANDDVAPRGSAFAESFDGGKTWEVKGSRGGSGYAIRVVSGPTEGSSFVNGTPPLQQP